LDMLLLIISLMSTNILKKMAFDNLSISTLFHNID
jgi:hypothetical protein